MTDPFDDPDFIRDEIENNPTNYEVPKPGCFYGGLLAIGAWAALLWVVLFFVGCVEQVL